MRVRRSERVDAGPPFLYVPPLRAACRRAHFQEHLPMLRSTTASLKPADVEKKWIVIDAENAVVGRLASFIAMRLRGKHRPDYTPHVDCGDYVVVVNADKVKFTGRKLNQKTYYWHTGHPGGIKERTAEKILNGRFPERVLEKAVERMLPKESPLARKQMTHLRIYNEASHPHEAQNPEVVNFADLNTKNVARSA
jgi:large subunit ribosomal protein L13